MAMGRTSIRTPAKSGFQQAISEGVFGQGVVRAGLYARVSIHDQQTRKRNNIREGPSPVVEPIAMIRFEPRRHAAWSEAGLSASISGHCRNSRATFLS